MTRSNARRRGTLTIGLAAAALAVVGLTTAGSAEAKQAATGTVVVQDYQAAGWSYLQTEDPGDGFTQPDADLTGFTVGTGGFGDGGGVCSFDTSSTVGTTWDSSTYIDLRHDFTVPPRTTMVHIAGTIDNLADVYVNGQPVGSFSGGNCDANTISVDVPASALNGGDQSNLLAVRAANTGGPQYVDLQITATYAKERATVTDLTPASGPQAGGNTVVISGTGFLGASKVVFGKTNATSYTVVSDTEIDAVAPAGTGKQAVRVQTVGLSAKTKASLYRYVG